MDVGVGLPSAVPGFTGQQVLDWARTAEARGFSSLAVLDRLVYGNADPLVTLAAAGAVTERIKLVTAVLIPTIRGNGAVLAKQAASVQHLSGGRLVLGLGLGAREDDYTASGTPFAGRGRRLEAVLDELVGVWDGEPRGLAGPIGPAARPPLIIGGYTQRSHERAIRYGDGWIAGGMPPTAVAPVAGQLRKAWEAAGRKGSPRILASAYFSLGPDAERIAQESLGDYYAWLGDMTGAIVSGALTDAAALREALAAFQEAGTDELILMPAGADPGQVDLLAEAIGR